MSTLYAIPHEWAVIEQKIEENDGELTPELETEIQGLIETTKDKVEPAALAKRNLELRSEQAIAQAKVLEDEADRIKSQAEVWKTAADRLGQLLLPALAITGKVQTPAGTVYTRTNASYGFELKAGYSFFDLPAELWRQRDPELNKMALRKLAETDELPESILVTKSETTSVCLSKPRKKGETTDESMERSA